MVFLLLFVLIRNLAVGRYDFISLLTVTMFERNCILNFTQFGTQEPSIYLIAVDVKINQKRNWVSAIFFLLTRKRIVYNGGD